jgi:hypothetical protein
MTLGAPLTFSFLLPIILIYRDSVNIQDIFFYSYQFILSNPGISVRIDVGI